MVCPVMHTSQKLCRCQQCDKLEVAQLQRLSKIEEEELKRHKVQFTAREASGWEAGCVRLSVWITACEFILLYFNYNGCCCTLEHIACIIKHNSAV